MSIVGDVPAVPREERLTIGCVDGGKNDVLDERFASIGEISTPSLSSARLHKMSKSKQIAKAHHHLLVSAPVALLSPCHAMAQ